MDRGAWWAAVHEVTQSRTRLKRLTLHACIGKGNGNPLNILAWRIPGTEETFGLPSMGSQSQTRLKRLSSSSSNLNIRMNFRTTLVVQWLWLCLPLWGSQVQSLVWEDSTRLEPAKPVCHNYWSPRALEPVLCNTTVRSLCTPTRSRLHLQQLEKVHAQQSQK